MKIPLLDLKGQYRSIKSEVEEVLKKVIERQDFILGEEGRLLEKEIAEYCGSKYAVGVASGTDALILALRALDIGPGDEVITTPFTFFATAEAASLLGAKPVFVDIEPRTYNIDPRSIEKAITSRTKVIIPVHLYGQCADMDPIMVIAGKYKLKVIEDTAQAIGATYKGRKAGSIGDIGTLSFFPSKNLGAFGDAGMVVTDDKEIAERIGMLRVHGSARRYIHSEIGMNSRLDNLQAAVLRVKLRRLDGWLEARRNNAAHYSEELKGLPIALPYVPDHNVHTYHQYVLRVKDGLEKLMKFLIDSGIETRTYYPVPLHLQECYRGLGYKKGDLPESEGACNTTFAIAVYPEMTAQERGYIVSKIEEFYSKKSCAV
ncbi:MAG: DegT/DnrJ/EryC1/StrS family aminotransferase [Candidatus Omnitrophica bacterium]|nr:DegT/DnrJ/EryC1/StrS family aminotransferase [Candidatus Omnitrophota bacterium]